MAVIDPTPLLVSFIAASGTVIVGFLAYKGNKKTEKKIEDIPTTLVQDFARLNPGVDTVEKVIELLYTEIERLKEDNRAKDERIDNLLSERGDLLEELQHLKSSLAEHKRKLEYLEVRIKKSITEDQS